MYVFTKEEEKQVRSWPTERLLNFINLKEDIIKAMTLVNDDLIKNHGKKFAANMKQIENRADKFIETAKDEIQKRGIK